MLTLSLQLSACKTWLIIGACNVFMCLEGKDRLIQLYILCKYAIECKQTRFIKNLKSE